MYNLVMYRQLLKRIKEKVLQPNHPILLIYGHRQVGKTTLAKSVCEGKELVSFNFDLLSDINEFTKQDRHSLSLFAKKYKNYVVFVDEVQKSPEAVGIIKYLYDNFRLSFLLTGSSEIKIRRGIGDSLAGRVEEFRLYPLSLSEIDIQNGLNFDKKEEFSNYEFNQSFLYKYLVYGSLPQLLNIGENQYGEYLKDFSNNLLSKDVLEIGGSKKPVQVFHLAKLLALQIGSIVNYNELAQNTGLSRVTVLNYIDIFEQMGLVVKADPISTNAREAITKRAKIYFTDLGIRNSLIDDFSSYIVRNDKGQILENAVFMGIKRSLDYSGSFYKLGFFRSEYGAEIDIVKKTEGKEELFEVGVGKKVKRKKKNVSFINLDNCQKYLY